MISVRVTRLSRKVKDRNGQATAKDFLYLAKGKRQKKPSYNNAVYNNISDVAMRRPNTSFPCIMTFWLLTTVIDYDNVILWHPSQKVHFG